MNNNIPPGWDLDYDGNRWFYKYRSSGLIQYTFPKDGDEYPDFVDASAPVPVLAPEERLESQQQLRRRGNASDGNGRPQPKDQPSAMSATGGPVSTTWEDDGGDDGYFQPENFMYLGPGAYTDVSPLAGGEEADDSAISTNGRDVGFSATPDTVPVASPPVSEISTPQIPKGTPVAVQAEPGAQPPLSFAVIPTEPTVAPIAPIAPVAPVAPVADEPVGHTSPDVPMLDSSELPHELPEAPYFDPVGRVAEMPTDMTAMAHIELHPDPVEMGDNAVLAPIETFYINSGLAELPTQSSPTERKKEPEPPPPRRRAYSTPRVYPFQPTEDDDPNRPPTPLGGTPRLTPSPQPPTEAIPPDRSASFSPLTPSTASTPGDNPPEPPNAAAVSPPEGAGPDPQRRKPTPQGVFKIARKPTNAGSKPGFRPWTPGAAPPKPSPDSSEGRDLVRSGTPSTVAEPLILPTESKGQGQPHHQPHAAPILAPPAAPLSIPMSGPGTARTSPPPNSTQHLLSQAPGPKTQPGDESPPVPPKDNPPTPPSATAGHLTGTTTPPVLRPGATPQPRQGRVETSPTDDLPSPVQPPPRAFTAIQDPSASQTMSQTPGNPQIYRQRPHSNSLPTSGQPRLPYGPGAPHQREGVPLALLAGMPPAISTNAPGKGKDQSFSERSAAQQTHGPGQVPLPMASGQPSAKHQDPRSEQPALGPTNSAVPPSLPGPVAPVAEAGYTIQPLHLGRSQPPSPPAIISPPEPPSGHSVHVHPLPTPSPLDIHGHSSPPPGLPDSSSRPHQAPYTSLSPTAHPGPVAVRSSDAAQHHGDPPTGSLGEGNSAQKKAPPAQSNQHQKRAAGSYFPPQQGTGGHAAQQPGLEGTANRRLSLPSGQSARPVQGQGQGDVRSQPPGPWPHGISHTPQKPSGGSPSRGAQGSQSSPAGQRAETQPQPAKHASPHGGPQPPAPRAQQAPPQPPQPPQPIRPHDLAVGHLLHSISEKPEQEDAAIIARKASILSQTSSHRHSIHAIPLRSPGGHTPAAPGQNPGMTPPNPHARRPVQQQQMPIQGFNGPPNAQPHGGPGMYAQPPMQVPAGPPAARPTGPPNNPHAAPTQEKVKSKWFSKFLKSSSSSSKTMQKASPQQQQQMWQGPNGLFIPPSQSPGPGAPWSPGSFGSASPFTPPSGPPPQGYSLPQPSMQPPMQQGVPPRFQPMNPAQMHQQQFSGGGQMASPNMGQWGPPPAAAASNNAPPPQAAQLNQGHLGPQAPASPTQTNTAAQSTQKQTQAAENASPQRSQDSAPRASPPNPQHAKPTPDSASDGPARTESVRSDISFTHISEAQAQPVLRPQIVQVSGPASMQMARQPQPQLQKNGFAPQGHAPSTVAPQLRYGPGPQAPPGSGHNGQQATTNFDSPRLTPLPLRKSLSAQMAGAGPSSSARESMVSDISSADSADSRRVSVMSTGPGVARSSKLVKAADYSGGDWGDDGGWK